MSMVKKTTNIPVADTFYQFYIISPISENSCHLKAELHWETRSLIKKLLNDSFWQKNISE